MEENANNNAVDPKKFNEMLEIAMQSIHLLFEITREHELSPVNNGVRTYYEEDGKTGFQVSGQFKRPGEFLQTLLDIIRVNFEPNVLGTFFLNSNMCFLHEQIPEEVFQLGYISIVSDPGQGFRDFWENQVRQHLFECGYEIAKATSIYAVATTGEDRYRYGFLSEIATTLSSSFSLEEAENLIRSQLSQKFPKPKKHTYAGYCFDPALNNHIRLSLWFFLPIVKC